MEVANSLGNPCAICMARPYLAPSKLTQPGSGLANSIDDFCTMGMANGSARLPQTEPDVVDSPDVLCPICKTETTPDTLPQALKVTHVVNL